MERYKKGRWVRWAAALLLAVLLSALLLWAWPRLRQLTVEDLLAFMPQNKTLASGVVLLLYGVKSLTVVFPLYLLYLAVGSLFSPGPAILLNLAGLSICALVPYALGRKLGRDPVDRLLGRFPKAQTLRSYSLENGFFVSFFLRVINLLPGDLVSLFLGAADLPVGAYLSGSLLGLLPGMLPATLLGRALTDPAAHSLLLPSLALTVGTALGVAWLRGRFKSREKPTGKPKGD